MSNRRVRRLRKLFKSSKYLPKKECVLCNDNFILKHSKIDYFILNIDNSVCDDCCALGLYAITFINLIIRKDIFKELSVGITGKRMVAGFIFNGV